MLKAISEVFLMLSYPKYSDEVHDKHRKWKALMIPLRSIRTNYRKYTSESTFLKTSNLFSANGWRNITNNLSF